MKRRTVQLKAWFLDGSKGSEQWYALNLNELFPFTHYLAIIVRN